MTTKPLTVRIDPELLLSAKRLALETGITMTEVISRILVLYIDGKVVVKKKETSAEPPA